MTEPSPLDESGIPRSLKQRVERARKRDAWHFERKDIDVDTYMRMARRSVADFAATRHLIYLDSRYWFFCRDASIGTSGRRHPVRHEIWRLLKRLVRNGCALCPMNYPVYHEMLRLKSSSRMRTARVIDKL